MVTMYSGGGVTSNGEQHPANEPEYGWALEKIQKDEQLKDIFINHLHYVLQHKYSFPETATTDPKQILSSHLYEASFKLLHLYLTQHLYYRSWAQDILSITCLPADHIKRVIGQLATTEPALIHLDSLQTPPDLEPSL